MFLVSGPLGVQALSCFLHHSSDRTARAHRLNATVQYMIIYIYTYILQNINIIVKRWPSLAVGVQWCGSWFFYVIRSCLAFAHRLDGTLYKSKVQKLFSHNDRLKSNAKIIDWIRIAIFSKSIVIERERESLKIRRPCIQKEKSRYWNIQETFFKASRFPGILGDWRWPFWVR